MSEGWLLMAGKLCRNEHRHQVHQTTMSPDIGCARQDEPRYPVHQAVASIGLRSTRQSQA
eukprot:365551-Chlamydomonas_euryale.AAC.5